MGINRTEGGVHGDEAMMQSIADVKKLTKLLRNDGAGYTPLSSSGFENTFLQNWRNFSMNRLLVSTAVGFLMAASASASPLTFTTIEYTSTSLCGGNCVFSKSFGSIGVNDSNEVVTSFLLGTNNYNAYTYLSGVYSSPIQFNSLSTSFTAINNAGIISGVSATSTGLTKGLLYNGTSFTNTTITEPAGIPYAYPSTLTTAATSIDFLNGTELTNPSVLGVGFTLNPATGSTTGFVYNPANSQPYTPFLCATGATTTNAENIAQINSTDYAVGFCKNSSGTVQGFIYDYDTPSVAPTILGTAALATGLGDTVTSVNLTSIDEFGDLAGYYNGGANGLLNGFYCKDGLTGGALTLTNCSVIDFPSVDDFNAGASVTATYITSINDVGSIAGYYFDSNSNFFTFLATTTTVSSTPEPGTIFLAAISITGLVVFQRRRKALRR
jgi:hypothetical protein